MRGQCLTPAEWHLPGSVPAQPQEIAFHAGDPRTVLTPSHQPTNQGPESSHVPVRSTNERVRGEVVEGFVINLPAELVPS